MKSVTKNRLAIGAMVVVAAAGVGYFRWASSKPTSETDCSNRYGQYGVLCPESIIITRHEVDCVTTEGKVRFKNGREEGPHNPGLAGLGIKVFKAPGDSMMGEGLFNVEFTIPEGTSGQTFVSRCNRLKLPAPQ